MRATVLVILLFLLVTPVAVAENGDSPDDWDMRFDMGDVMGDIDEMATSLVSAVRTIAVITVVIMLVWVGVILWQGKDAYALEAVKTKLIFIFVGLFLIFSTEAIARFIFSIFGW